MSQTVFNGAEAKIYVAEQLIGVFESISWNVNIGTEPIHILGSYGAKEIAHTSYEAVSLNCSGFRVIKHGAFTLPKVPRLQDLLNLNAVTIAVVDRETGENIMTVTGCKATSYSGAHNAKATSRIQISYLGVKLEEEDGAQTEVNPTELPTV